jgi:hypothetical protein
VLGHAQHDIGHAYEQVQQYEDHADNDQTLDAATTSAPGLGDAFLTAYLGGGERELEIGEFPCRAWGARSYLL